MQPAIYYSLNPKPKGQVGSPVLRPKFHGIARMMAIVCSDLNDQCKHY
jgi:hypothetical protein